MSLFVNGEKIGEAAIVQEIARMKPHYRVMFKEQSEDDQNRQLREWAKENLIEESLLRQAAKERPADIPTIPIPSSDEALAEYGEHPQNYQTPDMLRVSQIVVYAKGSRTPDHALRIIERAADELRKGTCFEDLVDRYSDCPENEGDLGWFGRGEMVPEFEDAILVLERGQTSGIIQSSLAYHIAHLHDRKPSRLRTFEEVKEEIIVRLHEIRTQRAVEAYVDQLRERADIRDE